MLRRLLDMKDRPGQWGKFLACVITMSWAFGFTLDSTPTENWAAAAALVGTFGHDETAAWLFFVAVFPIFAVATDSVALRLFSTTTLLGTWSTVLIEAAVHWDGYRPAWGSIVVAFLGSLNADARLARTWFEALHDRR
jgi:hypothetical protein